MAQDVWNMLKAQGINAVIVVGSVDRDIENIGESEHAWCLAEVSPGEYLALEPTLGFTVKKEDNPRYYHGWRFNSPRDYRRLVELTVQYDYQSAFVQKLAGIYAGSRDTSPYENGEGLAEPPRSATGEVSSTNTAQNIAALYLEQLRILRQIADEMLTLIDKREY